MRNRLKTWMLRHLQVMLGSFGEMVRTPIASTLTLVVIGITLALPAMLYVLVDNVQRLGAGLETGGQISAYLRRDLSESSRHHLMGEIRALPGVRHLRYISRAEALAEFRRHSGFGTALEALSDNPLPAVLVVQPDTTASPSTIEALRQSLSRLNGVESATLDLAWVQRLHAILVLAGRGVWLLAGLLAVAVLLIIGNTIRLAVLNRQTEIEIIQLVGGTPAFIRRPFLYAGMFQGLLGGLAAWLVVEAGLLVLAIPVRELASLYGSGFALTGLGFEAGTALLAVGGALGWLGSRIAVSWHLARLNPIQ